MAISIVQTKKAQNANNTAPSVTFDSAPTSGNTLVCVASGNNTNNPTMTSSGWTEVSNISSPNPFGAAVFWKIAGASESSTVTLSVTGGGTDSSVAVMEVSGLDGNAPEDTAEDETVISTGSAKTCSTGTATPTSSTGLAIALFAGDEGRRAFNGASYNNSYVEQVGFSDTNYGDVAIATLEFSSASATSCTRTHTDSGDDAYGAIFVFGEASAGGTEISATTDALTLTELAASVNAETSITATVDSLTLTEFAATVSTTTNTEINATVDALTLTEYAADINASTLIQAAVDNLTVTEYQATVQAGSNTVINANTDALTLTEYQANVNAETNIAANTDALTVTEHQASISTGVAINAAVDALTLTEFQATVALENTYINASVDTLTLNTFPASVSYSGEVEQTFTGGFNVYNRIKTEKEKRQERVEMGIIEDLPKPQQEAVKKAARTENKAVAKSVLNNEIERLEDDIGRELLQQKTNELIDAYQDELKQILDEIAQEQQALIEFNQRNQNAVAVLMMMN